MNIELKQAIVNYIFKNIYDFQIVNSTIDQFKNYIYDKEGEYLIGGGDIAKFIKDANNLITNKYWGWQIIITKGLYNMRNLTKKQKKFLNQIQDNNIKDKALDPLVSVNEITFDDWSILVEMNDTEILYQEANRYLIDRFNTL